MKKIREKPPTGLTFGGYVHRNMTGTASGFSQSGNPPMGRNVNLNYAQQMLRLRPSNDLHLDVLGLPNTGVPHQPTTPRQRPQTQQVQSRRHTLAYSDSHAMEAIRSSTRGSLREHTRAKTVDEQLISSVKEDKTTKNPRKLDPLPKRPPSSSVKRQLSARNAPYGTLPPLAGEVDAELMKVVSKLEEELENSSESSSESEDEVRHIDM